MEHVAKALFIKGVTLEQIQQPELAIAVYDELVQRFGQANEVAILEHVAKALLNKGFALGQMQQPEAAIAVYDELVRRFGQANEMAILEQVAKALTNKGFALLIEAKKHPEPHQRLSLLKQSLEHFEQALKSAATGDQAMILGNQAYALFLLHRKEESRSVLNTALTQGGQTLYDSEIADSQLNELPEDTEFRALLDEIWQSLSAQQNST